MMNLILSIAGIVLKPILSLFNFIEVPVGLVSVTSAVLSYVRSGLGILNFFLPFDSISWAIDIFLSVFIIEHSYELIMWIVKKIPLLGVK